MCKALFTGVCTAMVTPFLDGKINYPMMEILLQRQMEANIPAVVIAGTTGESATLTDEEKIKLFYHCKKILENQTLMIAGTGSNNTAHSIALSIAAENAGADYIGVGAVFGTSTKKNARNLTVQKLREITNAVSIPVVAIGGINAQNLMGLKDSGVDGVAVVSAIFAAEDPGRATRELLALAQEMVARG